MARLNTRPSNNTRPRHSSETPDPASGEENRDPQMRPRDKGKRPASQAGPHSAISSTAAPNTNNVPRAEKRKRDERSRNNDGEDADAGFTRYFDPHQDPDERRAIKQQFRGLELEVQEKREELMNNDDDTLEKTVIRANDLYTHVKQTGDATNDSRLLVTVSDLGNKKAAQMGMGNSVSRLDLDEFVSKCISFMRTRNTASERTACENPATQHRHRPAGVDDDDDGDDDEDGEPLDWTFFGQNAVFPYVSRPPLPSFLLGPLSLEKRQRAATQRRPRNARDAATREARPETITREDLAQSQDSGLTKICADIYKLLKEHCREAERELERCGMTERADLESVDGRRLLRKVRLSSDGNPSLFDFVINPSSFGQTVENMFYVSFLIKEGKASVQFDEDGLPTICPSEPTSIEEQRRRTEASESQSHRHHAVFAMDFQTWGELKTAYGIEESLIPHREEGQTQAPQGGWYT